MCCRMPRRDMEQTLNMNTKNPYSILGRMINSFFDMILWCPHEFPGHSPRFETNLATNTWKGGPASFSSRWQIYAKIIPKEGAWHEYVYSNTLYSQQPWDISQNYGPFKNWYIYHHLYQDICLYFLTKLKHFRKIWPHSEAFDLAEEKFRNCSLNLS